jgi:hypothetical protein
MQKYLWPLVFWLFVLSIALKSQQPLVGLIEGVVVDQKRAPIPDAGLTATNIDSVEPESHRKTTGSDEKGFYQFVDVPPGRYAVVVKKGGYRDYKIPLVTVRPGETVKLPDVAMSPADE